MMKSNLFLFLFSILFLSQSCKNDIDPNDLGAVVEGTFKGVLKMDGNIINDDFQVEIVRLTNTSVMLNSTECMVQEIILEGNTTFGVLGVLSETDTLDSFGYTIEGEELSFLVNNSSVFKTFEGNKE